MQESLARDRFRANALALLAMAAFVVLSPGWTLIATFVPAMLVALGLYHLRSSIGPLPESRRVTRWTLIALAVQLVHFAEEAHGDFGTRFPVEVFDASPFAPHVFVAGNLGAYLGFVVALMAFRRGARPALVVLWFVWTMMVVGNALGHWIWCGVTESWFPGIWTSQLFWPVGWFLGRALWDPDL